MAVVTPLNNPGGPEGDTVTVDEQLLNTEYRVGSTLVVKIKKSRCLKSFSARGMSSVRYRTRLGDLKNKQST